MSHPGRLYSHP